MCMLLLLEPVRLTRTNCSDLQSLVDGVSGEDVLLIVGDLNSRVGSVVVRMGEMSDWA